MQHNNAYEQFEGPQSIHADTSPLNAEITVEEVRFAVIGAAKGKALGDDNIPVETLQNEVCIQYFVKLFNTCLDAGTIPDSWGKGIINPILKDVKADQREPLNYRGITITSAAYKVYCSVLNYRLSNWIEVHNGICDEQNGFRAGRSTADHLSTLSFIVETRIKKKMNTFATFIDFSKAYDRIDRSLLWHKLSKIGIDGKMFNALKSLYSNVKCTVRLNGVHSDWFKVQTGLKQGCILSPLLFNAFVNDLIQEIRRLHVGIPYTDDELISILLYADDIVLLSANERDMQTIVNCLASWCNAWGLTINFNKSKMVHFRAPSVHRSEVEIECGVSKLEFVDSYKYLGVLFTEHLDYNLMTKMVAQSASRALGLLISKDKSFGGMPYDCFTKCYNATVQATIDYSAAVWGTKSVSCVNAIQNRACRYFLGLGRYAPNAAVNGDMGWPAPEHKQWVCVTRRWCRLAKLDSSLLANKVFLYCVEQASVRCKNWCYRITVFFAKIEHDQLVCHQDFRVRQLLNSVDKKLQAYFLMQWKQKLQSDISVAGVEAGGNKLRTYRTFKENYGEEQYVRIITQKKYRSAYAKFRCGVAPIKIETCRYGLNRVPVNERLCETCNLVEDEIHVLLHCSMYDDIRDTLFADICNIKRDFCDLTVDSQFILIMSDPLCFKFVSKAMYCILNRRRCAMLR